MKKRLLRIVTYLLVFVMMATNLPLAMAAPIKYGSLTISRENPHFAGLKAPTQITHTAPLYLSDGEESTYHTDLEIVAQEIRTAMKARVNTFTVGYIVDDVIPQEAEAANAWLGEIAYERVLEAAFNETNDPTEGDSLRLCYYGETPVNARYWIEENQTKLSLTYTLTYFTDAAQEAELTAAVDALLEEFAFTAQATEQEKADAIYRWLCDNIDYDYTSPGYLKHSAYAAMINKTAVCQGYAVLFYRLAEEAGLDARAITGVATHNSEPHAWNIVKIEDYYYYLDSTWDANEQPQNYGYYLRGETDFYGHTNDARYETAEFRARYPIALEGISMLHGIELTLGDWEIMLVGGQAVILKYLGKDAQVIVPAVFDFADYDMGTAVVPVDAIASYAFSDRDLVNTTIESITISEGISRLGIFAISYCNNLKELNLPSTLQIKNYGFTSATEVPVSCNNMETITLAQGNPCLKLENGILYTADGTTVLYCPPKNGLVNVTLPNGVKTIGNEAFAHHKTLQTIHLPQSLEEIDYFAFQTASKLKEITFNEGLERIGQYAFHNCYNLQSVHLPASLTEILSGAFFGTLLQTITVSEQNTVFSMQNGMLIGDDIVYKFALSTLGEQISVPEGVTEIDQGAFEGAAFKGITLPSSLQKIGQSAFSACKNLLHVTIPENVYYIGDMVFSGCDMLLSVVIPANVTRFGNSIFHLGMPETYVTVFGEAGSKAQEYCQENSIQFRLMDSFPCEGGHHVEKVMDLELSTPTSDVWRWECAVCGCKTHTFTKLYSSIADVDITYKLDTDTHVYDETKFTPSVLWIKKGETPLTENVDFSVEYGDNYLPGGNNYMRLKGMGEFRGELFIPLTIQRAPITEAVAELDCYTFEYDGNAKYPAVLTLTLNGKELTRHTDFVTTHESNIQEGTGYVIIHGNGNYTGELRVAFAITEHQHNWSVWRSINDLQHERQCRVSICEYYTAPQRADHRFDDEFDGICNDCGYSRDVQISIADAVAELDCDSFEYDGNPKQPWVQSLTLNGKELTFGTDFVLHFENNIQAGTGYVIISGNGNYKGELRIPFTITEHQHDWCGWMPFNNAKHYRFCTDSSCKEYAISKYADHCYDDGHDDVCNDCGFERSGNHSFTTRYGWNANEHWRICDGCDKTEGVTYAHGGGNATCQTPATCSDCGQLYGGVGDCKWELKSDSEKHWYQCAYCEDIKDTAPHSGGNATCTAQANCGTCGKAFGDLAEHRWYQSGDSFNHWDGCYDCTIQANIQPHQGGFATCGSKKTCAICSRAYGEPGEHNFIYYDHNEEKHWTYCACGKIDTENVYGHGYGRYTTENEHWLECFCGHIIDREAHTWKDATCNAPKTCIECGDTIGDKLSHKPDNGTVTKKATCAADGTKTYKCTLCKTTLKTETIAKLKTHTYSNDCDTSCDVCEFIRTISHSFGGYVYNNDATTQKDGTKTRTCSVCKKTQTIDAVGTKIKNPFKDVQAKEYYTEPVMWAVEKGITNGTSETTFSPTNECTRGQIVTFLWRAAGSPEPRSSKNPFVDVKSDQYYYKAVLWAVEKGITTGTSANTFSPDAACTRGQVVTFMWRAKNKPAATTKNSFKDVQVGAYYYDAVLWAVKNGITNGMSATSFAPDATCTRGQIVTFLYRSYK